MNPKIIIPARLDSSRFPEKMITPIHGVPLILATARNASRSFGTEHVIVATCDMKIKKIVEEEFRVCLTCKTHETGTDRVAEACINLKLAEDDFIINLQGDEPFVESEDVKKVFNPYRQEVSTGKCMIKPTNDVNRVKLAVKANGYMQYASRCPVPHAANKYQKHIGIFGFHVKNLLKFYEKGRTLLESQENIEVLRFLEIEIPVMCYDMKETIAIDTIEDLRKIGSL